MPLDRRIPRRLALGAAVALALPHAAAAEAPEDPEARTLYSIGVQLGRSVHDFHLDESEIEIVQRGFREAVLGNEGDVDESTVRKEIKDLRSARMAAAAREEARLAQAFLEEVVAQDGATRTDSGLVMIEIEPGTGESPTDANTVRVHYHGTLRDGTVFDSSRERGQPAEFALNRVIPCWTEGLQRMKVGGKSRLVCPPDIAYGDRGAPPRIPGGAALSFEVELLEIVK